MGGEELPYAAVSPNGRAMQWKAPLWNAIANWAKGGLDRSDEVVAVEQAVQTAMRLAIECSRAEVPNVTDAMVEKAIRVYNNWPEHMAIGDVYRDSDVTGVGLRRVLNAVLPELRSAALAVSGVGADTKRLDWLESDGAFAVMGRDATVLWSVRDSMPLRAAIDASMASPKPTS